MGILTCIDSRHRLALPDTPLGSPSVPSYPQSQHQFERRSWDFVAPISPPMSNYDPTSKTDTSAAKALEEPPAAKDRSASTSAAAPRQQLPSLSSLFGPPQATRPLHSPLSEHPGGGSHSSMSPHERLYSTASSLDRPYSSSSYFSSTPTSSVSQPRSAFEPRPEDRPYGPLARPFSGPISPRAPPETQYQRQEKKPGESNHLGRWSIRQESGRNEYTLASREVLSYKSTAPAQERPDRREGHRREDGAGLRLSLGYAEQQQQRAAQHLPSTPSTGTAAPDGILAVKDGLGPKIWTGTHFLPRFVRAAEVPGEGMCYFYDDGSHCKTVIDGEAVTPHWGVTKAGKPRKRLAIACITCREKKIKCDPDYPRCIQCEKFGRICKFKNAPRGGHNASPSTPPAETDDIRRLAPLMRPPTEHSRPRSHHSSESVSPRTAVRPASPEPLSGHASKRMRIGFEHYGPRSPTGSTQTQTHTPTPDLAPVRSWQQQHHHHQQRLPLPLPSLQQHDHHRELPRIHEDALCRYWQADPRPDARL